MVNNWIQRADARLSSMAVTVPVTVYYRPCRAGCGQRLAYDGQEDAVFNLSNQSLFLYEAMFAYWDGMISSKLSFTAHHANMRKAHQRTQLEDMLPSRQVIRQALQCFLALLDIDYASFGCPCCNTLAHDQLVLIMDGTTLGSRKDLVYTATANAPPSGEPIDDL